MALKRSPEPLKKLLLTSSEFYDFVWSFKHLIWASNTQYTFNYPCDHIPCTSHSSIITVEHLISAEDNFKVMTLTYIFHQNEGDQNYF